MLHHFIGGNPGAWKRLFDVMTVSHLGLIFAAVAEDGLRGGAPQR